MFDTLWESFSLNLFEFNAIINDLIYLKFSFTLVNNCTKNKINFLFVCLIQISLFSKILSNSSSLHLGLSKNTIIHIWIFKVLFLHSNFFSVFFPFLIIAFTRTNRSALNYRFLQILGREHLNIPQRKWYLLLAFLKCIIYRKRTFPSTIKLKCSFNN